jgi:L-fuconolactonase
MTERIDSHHHLWTYQASEFAWLSGAMSPLVRNFTTDDLEAAVRSAGINGTVAVQARQSLEETQWLLSLSKNSPIIRGVVGWAPLCSDDFPEQLAILRPEKKLKGLRHIIQDEPDDNFILRADFNRGISAMANSGLVYDILIFARQLPPTIQFVDRHPNQIFVVDHIAKPEIKKNIIAPWRSNIAELARRPNVYCKLSGMVTEADFSKWSAKDLQPYVDIVLQAFGPNRLMAGSDWPVCLVATTYANWFSTLHGLLQSLSASEQDEIFGGVASRVYHLYETKN